MGRWIKHRLVVTAQLKKSKRTNKKKKTKRENGGTAGLAGCSSWGFFLRCIFFLLSSFFSHPTDHPRHDTPIYLSAFLFTLLARSLLFLFLHIFTCGSSLFLFLCISVRRRTSGWFFIDLLSSGVLVSHFSLSLRRILPCLVLSLGK